MSKQCQVTGKKTEVGNNRSHANNATKRTFKSNLQKLRFKSDLLGKEFTLSISTNGLRTLIKHGGIDAFVASKPISRLTETMAAIKTAILKKIAATNVIMPGEREVRENGTAIIKKLGALAAPKKTERVRKPNKSARLVKKTAAKVAAA